MASTRSARATKAAPVKKAVPKKAAKKTAAARKAPVKGVAPAKKAAKKAAPARKAAPAKKSPAKKTAAAKKAPGKKAAPAKKATKKAAPVKKAAPPKKAAVKKAAPAKKAAAKKAAPAKKPAARKTRSPFTAAFLRAQQAALIEERANYVTQADTLQAEAESLVADIDPGDVQFDEESGEGDTLAVERERDLALSNQARQAVEEIDHALAKFELGTYGICEVSGEPIPTERLEAIPWARERVEYKVGGLGRR
ncbi:MAG TPA: TraR/DksA C4-type zinc finger protein [Iamia sp.]